MMKKISLLLFLAILFSCEEKEQIIENADNLLIGNWVNAVYKDDKTTFSRSNSLPKENYGISFKTNGDYKEKTSGWCGTPPLSYFIIDGEYDLKEGLITISRESYPSVFSWRIISLTETNLVVEREFTEQEIAHRELMELFNEISNLAYGESCINPLDWSFLGYGSKACGGPQGYIAYSKNIDTTEFLKKVEAYSKAENDYNVKFGIISDCALLPTPIGVECKNGYPNLVY